MRQLPCIYFIAFTFLFSSLFSHKSYSVAGWDKQQHTQHLQYTPQKLRPGNYFTINTYKPEKISSQTLMAWFKKQVPNMQRPLGKPLEAWRYKQSSKGPTSINYFRNPQNELLIVMYLAYPVGTDHYMIAQLVSSKKAKVVKQYSAYLQDVADDAEKTFLSTNIASSQQNSKPPLSPPHLADTHPTFKAIWSLTTWNYSPSSGLWGANENIVAVFSDGSFTKHISAMFSENIQQLQQQYPKQWGQWQRKNGKVMVKWHGDKDFRKTEFSVNTKPAPKGQRLHGCYALSHFHNDDFVGGSFNFAGIKTWCFDKKGYFYQRTTASSSTPGVVASNRSENAGRYSVEDYRMSLRYNNGTTQQTGFAILGDKAITINGSRYKKSIQ